MKTETIIIGGLCNNIPVNDGAIAELLRPKYNRLFIGMENITDEEVATLVDGNVYLKLMHDKKTDALMLIFIFEYGIYQLNFDCPFDASIIPDLTVVDMDSHGRLLLEVVAVDSKSKVVKALRHVTMPTSLVNNFLAIVQNQLKPTFKSELANQWIDIKRATYSANSIATLPFETHLLTTQ
jgi:hypothetical protein